MRDVKHFSVQASLIYALGIPFSCNDFLVPAVPQETTKFIIADMQTH
jgi:hypothetical protein